MAEIPSIVNGPELKVKRRVEYDLPCPKCSKDMRITDVNEGAVVQCQCGNATWRPTYVPPWWASTRAFVLSLLGALLLGLCINLISSYIYEKYQKARDAGANAQPAATTNKDKP